MTDAPTASQISDMDETIPAQPPLRKLTQEELDIVLAKLHNMQPEEQVQLTPEQVDQLRRRLWWKRELHSPVGLAHLFPGLRGKK